MPGRVFCAGGARRRIHARVEAFRRAYEVSEIPFYLSANRIVLPTDGKSILRAIRLQFPILHPGIVVLDTLNRSISGSENDPADMGAYVDRPT